MQEIVEDLWDQPRYDNIEASVREVDTRKHMCRESPI